jgi:hypothetical protein
MLYFLATPLDSQERLYLAQKTNKTNSVAA